MNQTIFVIEDDENIREVVCEYLKESGYIVKACGDGKEALKFIENNKESIDLYLIDIMLPGSTGLEILKYIRIDSNAPVIMLTALDDEYTQLMSFDSLADDYITKPFSPRLLIKRVEAMFRRSGEESKKITYKNIVIDFESYEVKKDNEDIFLTLKELEIMKVLLNHNGKVLNRQQLLNHVWGYNYFGDERIVDVHIKNLRKKLGSDIVTTVKGVGYKTEH